MILLETVTRRYFADVYIFNFVYMFCDITTILGCTIKFEMFKKHLFNEQFINTHFYNLKNLRLLVLRDGWYF